MKNLFSKRSVIIVGAIGILLIALIASNQFARANFWSASTPTPTAENEIAFEITLVQADLNRSDGKLKPEVKNQLEKRLEMLYEAATLQVNAQKITPYPRHGKGYTPEPLPVIIPTGIINHSLLVSKEIVVENAWQNLVNGEYVQIYAGYLLEDLEQGVVAYGSDHTPLVIVLSPKKSGSLHITEVTSNLKIKLKSKKDDSFFFDIQGRKFTKSLDEIVPTVTPPFDKTKAETPTPLNPYP